ncbi:hypothetical protein IKF84_02245 [Candidatus Saccharibacteria bacterium]|nr:hypothetical protein [Candidatus Saccharibacteria bacterium]
MSKIVKKIVVGVSALMVLGMVLVGANASAAEPASQNTIITKAVLEGVWQCYDGKAFAGSWRASDVNGFIKANLSDNTVKLPYDLTDVSGNGMNCLDLMKGSASSGGLNAGMIPGIMDGNDGIADVAKFFAGEGLDNKGGLGYTATPEIAETEGDAQKLTFTLKADESEIKMCGEGLSSTPAIDNDQNAIVFPTIKKNEDGGVVPSIVESGNVPAPGSGGKVDFVTTCGGGGAKIFITVIDEGTRGSDGVVWGIYADGAIDMGKVYAKSTADGAEYTANLDWHYNRDDGKAIFASGKIEMVDSASDGDYVTDYVMTWGGQGIKLLTGINAKNTTGYKLAGISNRDSLKLTEQEVFELYRYYITDVFKKPVSCVGDADYATYESLDKPVVAWNHCGACRIDKEGTTDPDGSVISSVANLFGVGTTPDKFYFKETVDLDMIIKTLNNLNIGLIDVNDTCGAGSGGAGGSGSATDPTMSKPGSTTITKGNIVDCNQLENVGAMQWILCPVMNNEQYAASWIDNMTQDWLEVNPDIYTGTTINNVWGNIRNIANIVMMVFLLAIIFSQVTGYGIDNYGVKKMLPRLIVMAIAINLSLYICQMAVDFSNIAGVGLRNMFTDIGMSVGGKGAESTSFIGDMVMGIFAAAAAGGPAGIAGASLAISMGAGIAVAAIVLVVVLLLVVIIAVIVLFLMLGAREIMVIVCIITSPLAFAAFILPNTQNLFKKWWELFKAALIIFPICGAMGGISNLLRGMYDFTDSSTKLHMWGYAILLVLPYLGFFLMPMLLKNAISALGKVGGALTALGNTVKGGGKAIKDAGMKIGQNTNAFKDLQTKNQERNANRAIQRVRELDRKGKKVSVGDRQRAYEAQLALNKMEMDRQMAVAGAPELAPEVARTRAMSAKESQEFKNYTDQYSTFTRAQMGNELTSAISAYRSDRSDDNALRLQAAIASAEGRGMNKEMLAGFGGVELNATNANDAKILSRLSGSSDKILSQYGIQMSKIAGDDYEDESGRRLAANEKSLSLNGFIDSQGVVKLSRVSAGKGASWLNSANDDTWDAILQPDPNNPSGYNANALGAVDTHTLITAANNTNDGKVVTKINQIFAARQKAGIQENYSMSTSELATLKPKTAEVLQGTGVYDKAVAEIKSNPNSEANRQILNSMDQNVRTQLGLSSGQLNQTGANTTAAGAQNAGTNANTTAAGAQNAVNNANAKATASGGSASAPRPQVSAASSSPSGGYGISGNQPFANINNYVQPPQVPRGSSSNSGNVTPPQGGNIPRENSGAPKMDWNVKARGDTSGFGSGFGTSGNQPMFGPKPNNSGSNRSNLGRNADNGRSDSRFGTSGNQPMFSPKRNNSGDKK